MHDFVAVPLPVDEATRVFTTISDGALAELVATSWNRHAGILRSSDPRCSVTAVAVTRQGHHFRHDAAIINIGWSGDGGLPTLDADLELVSFGDSTHLHLMGRYDMPAHIERFTDVGSLEESYFTVARRNAGRLEVEREPVVFSIVKPGESLLEDEIAND